MDNTISCLFLEAQAQSLWTVDTVLMKRFLCGFFSLKFPIKLRLRPVDKNTIFIDAVIRAARNQSFYRLLDGKATDLSRSGSLKFLNRFQQSPHNHNAHNDTTAKHIRIEINKLRKVSCIASLFPHFFPSHFS